MSVRWAPTTLRYWTRMAVGNISAALVVTVAFSGVTWQTPWRQALDQDHRRYVALERDYVDRTLDRITR